MTEFDEQVERIVAERRRTLATPEMLAALNENSVHSAKGIDWDCNNGIVHPAVAAWRDIRSVAGQSEQATPLRQPDVQREAPALPLPFINISAWQDQPVPEREWAVLNRIPMRNVTLFSGEGAIGKSIVSLQLAVAHGGDDRYWLGVIPEPGPALVLACEDDNDELHRRLADIANHYHSSFTDLKNLHLMCMAGEDALLGTADRNGLIQPTRLFARLKEAACDIRPKLIVLDNSADVFGGNENDRGQVRQFIGKLRNLAIAANSGVLLTSHPSLTGISTGSGISGSTQWHNSVRSRLYMKRATTAADEEPDPNLRVIEVMKANYGPVGETITLRWNNGLFLPISGMSTLEKMASEQTAENVFISLLNRFTGQGRNVSDKAGKSYAPALFAKEPEAKAALVRKEALADAMRRLFAADKIHMEPFGYLSRGTSRLATGPNS